MESIDIAQIIFIENFQLNKISLIPTPSIQNSLKPTSPHYTIQTDGTYPFQKKRLTATFVSNNEEPTSKFQINAQHRSFIVAKK